MGCIFSYLRAKSDAATEEGQRAAQSIVFELDSRPHVTLALVTHQVNRLLLIGLYCSNGSLWVWPLWNFLLLLLLLLLSWLLVHLLLLLIILLHGCTVRLPVVLLSVLELSPVCLLSCLPLLLILLSIFLHLDACPLRNQVDVTRLLALVLELVPLIKALVDTQRRQLDCAFADQVRTCEVLVVDPKLEVVTDIFDINNHGLVPDGVFAGTALDRGPKPLHPGLDLDVGVHLGESVRVAIEAALHDL